MDRAASSRTVTPPAGLIAQLGVHRSLPKPSAPAARAATTSTSARTAAGWRDGVT